MTSKFYRHPSGRFEDDTDFIERMPDGSYVIHRKNGALLIGKVGSLDQHIDSWVEIEDPRPACVEGYVWLPVRPTSRMLIAGHLAGGQNVSCGRIYAAMVEQWRKDNA